MAKLAANTCGPLGLSQCSTLDRCYEAPRLRQNDAVSRGEDWRHARCGRRGFAHACPRGEIQGRNPRYALQIHSRYSKIQGGLAISSDGAAAATGVPDELGGA
uniref:Uncharacterized protein n=1 Tax=Oryza meridionalis TaxID=40149 RepID=A0A0E0CKD2_9ORYZ